MIEFVVLVFAAAFLHALGGPLLLGAVIALIVITLIVNQVKNPSPAQEVPSGSTTPSDRSNNITSSGSHVLRHKGRQIVRNKMRGFRGKCW